MRRIRSPAVVQRIDGQSSVSVQGSINPAVANARELMAALKRDFLPGLAEKRPDVRVVIVTGRPGVFCAGTDLAALGGATADLTKDDDPQVLRARELGIPAVVGCFNATSLLKTGDRVRVDGGAGTVEILDRKDR